MIFALFLFLFMPAASAAVVAIPDVPGLHGNGYTPSLGQLAGTQPWPSGRYYPATGNVNLGGRLLSIPAKIPLASTAGTLAKAAMRASPWLLVGTLALDYLNNNGIVYDPATLQLMKTPGPLGYVDGYSWRRNAGPGPCNTPNGDCTIDQALATLYPTSNSKVCNLTSSTPTQRNYICNYYFPANSPTTNVSVPLFRDKPQNNVNVPATQADIDSLPDPIPTIGPELGTKPYMPTAPVDAPVFTPGKYPLGAPYTAPDGSTKQDHAHVTNNTTNNSVTITTSTTTINNINGDPVTEPDTPTETQQDQCEKYPNSVGCSELGTLDGQPSTGQFDLEFQPETDMLPASCPASITVLGHSLSFQPACDAMTYIKPVVLVMASLLATFILFGSFRDS